LKGRRRRAVDEVEAHTKAEDMDAEGHQDFVKYQIDARERAQKWVKADRGGRGAKPENKDIVAKLKLETEWAIQSSGASGRSIPGAPNPRTFGFDKKGENDADLANDSLGAGWLKYHRVLPSAARLWTRGAYLGDTDAASSGAERELHRVARAV
jgi:hypothetical protein